jgi:hypothetical protein
MDNHIENPSADNRIFLNGKQLAQVLDVSPPTLSEAVKNGYNCAGYPVGDWGILTDSGRIKGFDVPEYLVSGERNHLDDRPNPTEIVPNKGNISPNKGNKPVNQPEQAIYNYSLLPAGEDYVRPIGMVALSSVLKKALDKDTPQSRAVIGALLAMFGAITGHAVSNNATGAGIGAMAGFGLAIYMYKYFNPNNNLSYQSTLAQQVYRPMVLNRYIKKKTD